MNAASTAAPATISDPTPNAVLKPSVRASTRDERLKALMSAGSARFWRMVEPIAVATGSDDPPRDARTIVALLDGLILDYLTRTPADPEVIRRGLKRLLGRA